MAIIRNLFEPVKEDWKKCPVMQSIMARDKKRAEAAFKKYNDSLKNKKKIS